MEKLINILLIFIEINNFVNSEFTYNSSTSSTTTLNDQYSRSALLLPGKSHPDVDLDEKWIINPKNYHKKYLIKQLNTNDGNVNKHDNLKRKKLAEEILKKRHKNGKSKSNSIVELPIDREGDVNSKLIKNTNDRTKVNVRHARQLSKDDDEFRESTAHLTPIIIDYSASNEESYEEMDELLKMKKKQEENEKSFSMKKYKRGDMDPIVSSLLVNNDNSKDNHDPKRGDLASTRSKRSFYYYDYDDGDYKRQRQSNELWGFGEDDGVQFDDNFHYDYDNDYDDDNNYQELKKMNTQHKQLIHKNEQNDESSVNDDYNRMRIKKLIEKRDKENRNRNSNKLLTLSQDNLMEQRQKELSVIDLEEARLKSLPILAQIIIQSDLSKPPELFPSRNNFDDSDIGFPGINPSYKGLEVSNFPVASTTSRPLTKSPHPCVWAIIQCCSTNNVDYNRLFKCFEFMNCPGVIYWDPEPCRNEIVKAARAEATRYYSTSS